MTEIPKHPRILVVGGGAREHAIVWKLAESQRDPQLYAAPGNPGIAELAACVKLGGNDVTQILEFAKQEQIDLVVVGPEAPLGEGLVDALLDAGVRAFGPQKAAARLETSKVFSKQVMKEAGVPTASYEVFGDAETAKAYIRTHGAPIVIKADGLAAGKGVVVAGSVEEAEAAIDAMMVSRKFGSAGLEVVVEEVLTGPEASLMFFIDQHNVVPMVPAQDHKRIGEGDTGPNTGGMGAFAPIPGLDTVSLQNEVTAKIVQPTLAWLRDRGIVYRGVLYVGLMLTAKGPQVIEFNVRFGDPEAEVVLPLLDTDLVDVLWAVTADELSPDCLSWQTGSAVCVVLATPGYPEQPATGQVISGVGSTVRMSKNPDNSAVCFHAGTRRDGDELVTSGGRVLTLSATGDSMDAAREVAYQTADTIYFEGMQLRRDIGLK